MSDTVGFLLWGVVPAIAIVYFGALIGGALEFRPRDLWIGVYFEHERTVGEERQAGPDNRVLLVPCIRTRWKFWIILVPMFPIVVSWTTHEALKEGTP